MAPTYLKKKVGAVNGKSTSVAAAPKVDVSSIVRGVIDDIRQNGDAAVHSYSEKFDKWSPPTVATASSPASYRLSAADIQHAIAQVPAQTIADIKEVQANVRRFAQAQKDSLKAFELETAPGVFLGQRHNPIAAVGAYIPGGRYALFASAHMTILTAKVAGVPTVVACTPPNRGHIPYTTVAAMHLAGADAIFILGGIQAIAAMALGTETIPKVDFLAGPGNAFVAEAKRQLYGEGVGIDLFAGPTEVLIVADDTADPLMVATDLLSQAEHGPDSPAILVTTSAELGRQTMTACDRLLETLVTAPIASVSWRDLGEIVICDSLDEAYRVADTQYASEHVQVLTARPREALDKIQHYGALFLGPMTCVSYGDKCIGTNHVLPTRSASRYTGGLWVGKFLRTVTYQEVRDPAQSGRLGQLCGRAARAELFEGHARSGDLRAHLYLQDDHDWINKAKD